MVLYYHSTIYTLGYEKNVVRTLKCNAYEG